MELLRRHIFLFDGLGAVLSTFGTAVLLPRWSSWIGLPVDVLWALAVPAALFATYSLSCWFFGARLWPWLAVIMVGNLAYCVGVAFVMANFGSGLTALGAAYFGGEMLVIAGVVGLEGYVLRTSPPAA
ncbi:MAG: hypothetical protein AAGA48_25455 [Myxococcota bacterium]